MYQVIEFYQQNLQLARESGQRREEMSALASLGRAYDALHERDKAVEFYELALNIARELGDGRAERDALKHLNETLNPLPQKDKPEPKRAAKKAARSRTAGAKVSQRKKTSTVKSSGKAQAKPSERKLVSPEQPSDSNKSELEE